ncbi:hypothetical protein PENFLA_c019G02685 [Penicillium flavigenum]|uniref:LysM domain-containing protein n=1 Tax=Penicillium flavigenum TaxID=254877 RepID=A0A1V6SZ09_9EURO|nr:hypothetical protein PENFLA_c019G02685 [Penicillium flavigenum]
MGCFRLRNFIALIGVLLVVPTKTSGAAVSVKPQASSDGLCYKYVVQAGETCSMISQAQAITVADIETYNARSWKWPGCGQIPQGTLLKKTTASTGMTKYFQQFVASSETPSTSRAISSSATKSVPTTKSTTMTTRTTSTKTISTKPAKPSKATSTTSTKSSQTKTSTNTKRPAPVDPWSLTMYSKKDCTGDYYILQGHNVGYSEICLNLHSGLSSKYTETSVSCKWFTDGGNSQTNCDVSTLEAPQSWIVQGGICAVYDVKNCGDSLLSNAYTQKSCQSRDKFDTPKFLSMNCYAEG